MPDTKKDAGFLFETTRLSPEEMAKVRDGSAGPGASVSVMMVYRDGVEVIRVDEGQSLVVGRSAPADVVVRDSSLSRQHAVIEVLEGVLWVEDLGSTNGTWVSGRRCDRSSVAPDDEVRFGTVTATVLSGDSRGAGHWDGHERFRRELEAEVARARAHRRSFALAVVRAPRERRVGSWLPALRGCVREFDRLGMYGADTVEVLLPEADEAVATEAMGKVLEQFPFLLCGVAVFPRHASNAEELMEVALGACPPPGGDDRLGLFGPGKAGQRRTGPSARVARSPITQRMFAEVDRVSQASIPVLIIGETGAGKEVVARSIHEGSKRADKPLICVNCASIPSQLLESTLFGHERGAFTGAAQRTAGVFEAAHGGSLLLDEIGELPAAAQASLLRVLEERRITRVGSTREVDVDVRVLAATHRDLEEMTKDGRFRQDLWFRLNVMVLRVPALRERPEDIEPLAQHFLRSSAGAGERGIVGIDPDALELLVRYGWPGNVRELRNAIDRAVVIANGATLAVEDLPEPVRQLAIGVAEESAEAGDGAAVEVNLREEVARFESDLILRTLRACDWDRARTARALGLPLRTLAHKMQVHGIRRAYVEAPR